MSLPTTNQTAPLRCAIYCRVSSPGQKENGSLEEQEAACRAYAAAQGYAVATVVHEVYGGEEPYRPQLSDLMDAIRHRAYDVLLVDKVDRFSRAHLETTAYVKLTAQEHGCRVVILEAPDESPMGQLLQAVLATFANLELYKIRERTGRGWRRRMAERGELHPGGQRKYGWRYADPEPGAKTAYVVDEEQAAVVRRIFTDLADKGLSLRQIARALNAEGVPPPTADLLASGADVGRRHVATAWSAPNLSKLVHHPAYWGEARSLHNEVVKVPVYDAHGRHHHDRTQGRVRTATGEGAQGFAPAPYAPDVWPGIVSKDLAMRALAQLDANRRVRTRPLVDGQEPEDAFLRGGYITCGFCGGPMTILARQRDTRQPGQYTRYYRCARHRAFTLGHLAPGQEDCPGHSAFALRVDLTEMAVWTEITDALMDPDRIPNALRIVVEDEQTRRDHLERDLSRYDTQLTKAQAGQRSLAEMAERTSDPDVQAVLLHRLEEGAASVRRLRAQRQDVLDALAQQTGQVEQMQDVVRQFVNRLLTIRRLTTEQRRTVLRGLGIQVVAWPHEQAPWFVLTSRFPALEASWHGMPHVLWLAAGDYYTESERLPVWEALGQDDTDAAGVKRRWTTIPHLWVPVRDREAHIPEGVSNVTVYR